LYNTTKWFWFQWRIQGELISDICDILILPQRVSNPRFSPNFFRLNNDTPSVVAVHRWERVSKEYTFP
jgi:hypothetical protein